MRFDYTVVYSFIWPIWLDSFDSKDPIAFTSDYKIVFYASKQGYFQGDDYVWKKDLQYKCMSCAEANVDWSSSSFKTVGYEPQVPWHIEEELQDHVDNHVKLGTWGAMLYKRRHAKINSI